MRTVKFVTLLHVPVDGRKARGPITAVSHIGGTVVKRGIKRSTYWNSFAAFGVPCVFLLRGHVASSDFPESGQMLIFSQAATSAFEYSLR